MDNIDLMVYGMYQTFQRASDERQSQRFDKKLKNLHPSTILNGYHQIPFDRLQSRPDIHIDFVPTSYDMNIDIFF